MPEKQNSASIQTGSGAGTDFDGRLRIIVSQMSQDPSSFTSQVRVQGVMENNNNRTVSHDGGATVERDISGVASYNPSDFDFSIKGNDTLTFISHTFTVVHDFDGTQRVNFTVHYGITNTPTFGHDQQVSVGLTLDPFSPNGGAWIRTKGEWRHLLVYVRYQNKWKIAKPYVRSGGVWKPAQ